MNRSIGLLTQASFFTAGGCAFCSGRNAQWPSYSAPSSIQRLISANSAGVNGGFLAADGGIRDTTVPLLRAAGAETVVMGSLAFGAPDLAERMRWLHAL